MNNLTPSEARRLIDKLHHNQTKEHGISILEEKYLAALEIALTVLEQQEPQTDTYRQIENDGWIEWRGGKRPVDSGAIVATMCRNGACAPPEVAVYWEWGHNNSDLDIIAYRVIENDGREE